MISSWRRLKAARRSKKEQPGKETVASLTEYPVVRIPTPPTIPLTSVEVLEFGSKMRSACEVKDEAACRDLVAKINRLAKESDANKRCFASNGTVKSVLAAAFESFSRTCLDDDHENVPVLGEILSALTLLFPLNGEALTLLASASSTRCLVLFLKSGDLLKKRNAVLVLRELAVCSRHQIIVMNVLSENTEEGAIEALFKLIKDPIGPSATKAALVVIHHTITINAGNEKLMQKIIDVGLVPSLLEMLVDAQRSVCEKALSILDGICSHERGREEVFSSPLTMPVTVKKILRVSNLATELAVSVLWKLCENEKGEEKTAVVEAIQVGAFQKLLLLLQVGCGEKTKERVSELLKLMNVHRDRMACSDGWIKSFKSF